MLPLRRLARRRKLCLGRRIRTFYGLQRLARRRRGSNLVSSYRVEKEIWRGSCMARRPAIIFGRLARRPIVRTIVGICLVIRSHICFPYSIVLSKSIIQLPRNAGHFPYTEIEGLLLKR